MTKVLVNVDVGDIAAAEAFYCAAVSLTPAHLDLVVESLVPALASARTRGAGSPRWPIPSGTATASSSSRRRPASCASIFRSTEPPDMQRYRNLSGNSGVVAYELSEAGIVVKFVDGWKYEYTRRSAGADTVATMRRLAVSGRGLAGFISRHAREAYARKFR